MSRTKNEFLQKNNLEDNLSFEPSEHRGIIKNKIEIEQFLTGNSAWPDEMSVNIISMLPKNDRFALTSLNKESWHYNNCINLQDHLKANDITRLENLLTSLYLNLSFFKAFFSNSTDAVISRWTDTLKKILITSKLSPIFRSITYVILFECINTANSNNVEWQVLKNEYKVEFDIQLQILQLSDPQAALAIRAYYSQLTFDIIFYEACLRQYSGPVISNKKLTLNYACILLKPFIGTPNEALIKNICLKELSADAETLAGNSTIPFLNALVFLTANNQSKIFLDKLQPQIDKLLLVSKFCYQKEIASILSIVLLNKPEQLILDILNPENLQRLHFFKTNSYRGKPLEDTVTLMLCKILTNHALEPNKNLALLKYLPYATLTIGDRELVTPETLINAFQHAFINLSASELQDYCEDVVFPLLTTKFDLERRNLSTFAEVFGKALSPQASNIIKLLLNYKPENSSASIYEYSHLVKFFTVLISSLPNSEQVEQITLNFLPMIKEDDKKLFILKLLTHIFSTTVKVDTSTSNALFKIKQDNALIELLEKNPEIKKDLLILIKETLLSSKCSRIEISQDDITVAMILITQNSEESIYQLITEVLPKISEELGENSALEKFLSKSLNLKPDKLLVTNNDTKLLNFVLMYVEQVKKESSRLALWDLLIHYVSLNDKDDSKLVAISLSSLIFAETPEGQVKKLIELESTLIALENLASTIRNKGDSIFDKHQLNVLFTIYLRNLYTLAFYYRFSPKAPRLEIFLTHCFNSLSLPFYPNEHSEVIRMLAPIAPINYRVRAIKELNFCTYREDELISLIGTLDDNNIHIGLNALWSFLEKKENHYSYSNSVCETGQLLPNNDLKLNLIKTVFNKAIKSQAKEEYEAFFRLAINVLSSSVNEIEVDDILKMNFTFFDESYADNIQYSALKILAAVPNNYMLKKYYERIFNLLYILPHKTDIYCLISRMLSNLPQSELNRLFPSPAFSSSNKMVKHLENAQVELSDFEKAVEKLTLYGTSGQKIIEAMRRLKEGEENYLNPYWINSSTKLKAIIAAVNKIHLNSSLNDLIQNKESELYKALNSPRLLPITFLGQFGFNHAKSLMNVEDQTNIANVEIASI
ncbi:MAG: hypothetical protein H0T84_12290 [Tatlockia sp.]|nr:hypothetical protein [Tatlockia sp.]